MYNTQEMKFDWMSFGFITLIPDKLHCSNPVSMPWSMVHFAAKSCKTPGKWKARAGVA